MDTRKRAGLNSRFFACHICGIFAGVMSRFFAVYGSQKKALSGWAAGRCAVTDEIAKPLEFGDGAVGGVLFAVAQRRHLRPRQRE